MILYRNTYDGGKVNFTVKPNDKAMISEEEEWELPKPITYGPHTSGPYGFIYDEIWWRPEVMLHAVNLDGKPVPYVVFHDWGESCFKAYLFNKKGESPREPERIELEDTVCEHCFTDVEVLWNPKIYGHELHCPYCGKPIHIE